ncbi:hypothetical protein [Leptothoe sp. PORK10 BA2]|uniref:hypothetical protein n=1 Tax=Leptothoe sp. PORK10 BA2 TaxID=3110254 RepID=UPI002B2136B5|nr:hypothetical protein [Leptothoe sp. PORK10 BA2]MEA5465964.1 hypothetical protein [Leptothoe sp. PORK10 BA2]
MKTIAPTIAPWFHNYGLRATPKNQRLWLTASLVMAVIYGILFWRVAFAGPYTIPDDGRQHLFWMLRYVDPSLFPGDIIADYFQSVAPAGYKALYWLGAQVGLHPFLLSKLLPPLLGVVGTAYCFHLAMAIIPAPLVAFTSTVILNQSLWMWDELASATPKAFNILLILAFLHYVVRQRLLLAALVLGLQGLFYPQTVFISVVLLGVRAMWPHRQRHAWRFLGLGLIVATIVLLPYALDTSPYGPVVTLEQAKAMAEFQPGSRNAFFYDDPLRYWLFAARSGLLPPVVPVTICVALFLPLLCHPRLRQRLPLLQTITADGAVLHQLGIASGIMFLAAHGLLFRLHLPSRYSRHSLKIIVAIAAALVLVTLLDSALRRLGRNHLWQQGLALALVAGFATVTVGYPCLLNSFLNVVYVNSSHTVLYQYLQQQPHDIRIASLAKEAENIPPFTGRSVLVSPGHSVAYHQGYYAQIRPRILDLMAAQYSPALAQLKSVITTYDIDFWLLDEHSFNLETLPEQWFKQFEPELTTAMEQLQQQPPALQRLQPTCTVVNDQGKTLISAACMLEAQE